MPKFKVLISDSLDVSTKNILEKSTEVVDLAGISAEDLLDQISEFDALIVRGRTQVTQEVISKATNLKVVGRAGVGVDNIDLEAAKTEGVLVINSPTATTNAVAEHSFALMLSLVRNVSQGDASMKAGNWDKKTLKGSELAGKTLGIIGMGRIGASVAEIAKVFSMTVLGYDPFIPAETIEDRHAKAVSLDDLYAQADIISLHMPLTADTKNLLNDTAFSKMKKGALLVCAARGGIIDETALLSHIDSGHIAGAALDVFTQEPPGLTDLIAHPNVVATPHIGAQTSEAQVRAAKDIAEEILNALEGKPLHWQVV